MVPLESKIVRMRNCPDAGAVTVYQTVLTVPLNQHPGAAGSNALPEHALLPVTEVPNVSGVALQGRSLAGTLPVKDTSTDALPVLIPELEQIVRQR